MVLSTAIPIVIAAIVIVIISKGIDKYPIIPNKTRRPNKYFAKKTVAMGLKFDSKWEAERWGQLKSMERAGIVTQLERQIRYDLTINDVKICSYIADFRYLLEEEKAKTKSNVDTIKS